jgi:hypothetical protein
MRLLLLSSLVAAGTLITTSCAKQTPYEDVMERCERSSYSIVENPTATHFVDAEADVATSRVLCLQVADAQQQTTCNAAVNQLATQIANTYGVKK